MFRVEVDALRKVLPAVVGVAEKMVVLPQFRIDARPCIHPMQDPFRLDAARIAPRSALGEVGASDFGDVAVFVRHSLVRADDVGALEPAIAADLETVVFGGRVEGEVRPLDVEFFSENDLSRPRLSVELVDFELRLLFPFVVYDRQLQGVGDRHRAGSAEIEIVPDDRLEIADLAFGLRLGDARPFAEVLDRLCGDAAVAQSRERGHSRVVPAVDGSLFDELLEVPLAHDEVREVEPCEFDLAGLRREAETVPHPVIEGTVILEFQRAEGMRDALQVVADGMGVVVHRVDAPLVPRPVMGRVQDPVDDGIAQVDVGRRHVDLCAETLFAVRVLSRLHLAEELQIFLGRAVPIGTFLPGFRQGPPRLLDLLGGEVADERLPVADQPFGVLIDDVEEVGCVHLFLPLVAQPEDVLPDRVDEFRLFLGRVGVVEEEVAFPVIFFGGSEIDEHALGVPDVEIPVRFGGKPCLDGSDLPCRQILLDELFDKIFCHSRSRSTNSIPLSIIS